MIKALTEQIWRKELGRSGAHPESWPIFAAKSAVIPLQVNRVRTPAANILKQEMLALGADAVTPMGTITCAERYVDVILLGTKKHYAGLLPKLGRMPFFGLEQLGQELAEFFQEKIPATVLADGRRLDYGHTLIMGVLNITPDSFYGGSRADNKDILTRAEIMLEEGADIVDVGAESTRPGFVPLSVQEEQERLLPSLQALCCSFPQAVISVDTRNSATAEAALDLGADIINDVSGGSAKIYATVKKFQAPYVLTYNGPGGMVRTMEGLAGLAQSCGLAKDKLLLDPGIGFGKTQEENLEILGNMAMLKNSGYPVLLGASRKSVIGNVLHLPPEERLEGTLAIGALAAASGAVQILRVHDVKEHVRCIRMAEALR